MEGTIGEIRGFAGNFAPKYWFYCDGQLLPIDQFTSLYSIIGTMYGGNGRTNFQLPDLRGRTLIHQGTGPSLTTRPLTSKGGVEWVTLTEEEMPKHDHAAATQGGSGSISGTATAKMYVNNATGDQSAPNNNFFGFETNEGGIYTENKDASSMLNLDAIDVDTSGLKVDVNGIEVSISDSGSSLEHINMQPYLVMSFIICYQGDYPVRP